VTAYKAGQSFSELPGDRHGVSANASETTWVGRDAPGTRNGGVAPLSAWSPLPSEVNHSRAAWLPFSATERFISNTRNATASVNTAIIQKLSK
jgi:hypothetical protein